MTHLQERGSCSCFLIERFGDEFTPQLLGAITSRPRRLTGRGFRLAPPEARWSPVPESGRRTPDNSASSRGRRPCRWRSLLRESHRLKGSPADRGIQIRNPPPSSSVSRRIMNGYSSTRTGHLFRLREMLFSAPPGTTLAPQPPGYARIAT